MTTDSRLLLSGNEAVACAAYDAGVMLGTGYPGTPSTEILEHFSYLGGKAQWAPNEKVALEVAIGAAFGGGRAIATMKHVGLNVAADPFFSVAYISVTGALIIVSADDPGMASSQNEQDNRHYAKAAGIPLLEPADSQEAYDLTAKAIEISERWHIPVLLRLTTRVCHSKSIILRKSLPQPPSAPFFQRDIKGRVMIPSNARGGHRKLRDRLNAIAAWNENSGLNIHIPGDPSLGIIASGIACMHAREAAPKASFLKIKMAYPLPVETIRSFVNQVKRALVIEEGDPWLVEAIRAAGIAVEGKAEMYRFGELNVSRVQRIINQDASPEPVPPAGKLPQFCPSCPHRAVFETLRDLNCIVAGDIGCYTLGALPPFEALDSFVCMGASIGTGLGLRHVLPAEQAQKVVSVIGDSTFMHSGITGLVEMVYNPPATGHVVLILDNGTTAMTGLQEHPGTGRTLDHKPTGKIIPEDLAKVLGIQRVHVTDPTADRDAFRQLLSESLASRQLVLIIARRPCLLAAKLIRKQGRDPHSSSAPKKP
ncbi:MAG: thiamine pyrophosphate-dependent enzyme [Kiritimatiellaeota bacterium]|nr:thiamine pyrophosphate-dependent enzyme [Kiritimatiellota bacterium]